MKRSYKGVLLRSFAIILVAAALPLVITRPYFLRVLILAGIFVVLAISYDFVVGQAGVFSLAQPAFYGIGAYVVAIIVTRAAWPFIPAFFMACLISMLIAIIIAIPSFRLRGSIFAIGTLGMAQVLQMIANNWIDLTEGPMCLTHVPPLEFRLPGGIVFSGTSLQANYYGILIIAILCYFLIALINSSRIGRALHAIRENELLAEMQGFNTLFYKILAFAISAALAGLAGGYYVTWTSVVCPTEMALSYTITLLIIINLGGVGSLRGVTIAAIVFTILPELLRASQEARLVIYGVILLLFVLYLPGGLEELVSRLEMRIGLPKKYQNLE